MEENHMAKNFIERLTEKQLKSFLGKLFPSSKDYIICKWFKRSTKIIVHVKYKGDQIYKVQLEEFTMLGFPATEKWLRYLYKLFGEEYKQAYLVECAKIFE